METTLNLLYQWYQIESSIILVLYQKQNSNCESHQWSDSLFRLVSFRNESWGEPNTLDGQIIGAGISFNGKNMGRKSGLGTSPDGRL